MRLRNVPTIKYKKGCTIAALFVPIRIVLILVSSVLLSACSGKRTSEAIDLSDSTQWREGDIALRCGWGMESRAVTNQGNSAYSHAGLLHHDGEHNIWQVIHAVPGEDEPEYLKAEALSVFYGHQRARAGAWLRIDCSDSLAGQATLYAQRKVAEHVLFDNDYLLEDTTMLYCTELVWQSYRTVGIDVSGGKRHDVSRFFCREGECIFPSDIEQSPTTLFVRQLTILK